VDNFSRVARRRGRAYSTITGNFWTRAEEPVVVRFLRQRLIDAAYDAANFIPALRARLPARVPPAAKVSTPAQTPVSEDAEPKTSAQLTTPPETQPGKLEPAGSQQATHEDEKTTTPRAGEGDSNAAPSPGEKDKRTPDKADNERVEGEKVTPNQPVHEKRQGAKEGSEKADKPAATAKEGDAQLTLSTLESEEATSPETPTVVNEPTRSAVTVDEKSERGDENDNDEATNESGAATDSKGTKDKQDADVDVEANKEDCKTSQDGESNVQVNVEVDCEAGSLADENSSSSSDTSIPVNERDSDLDDGSSAEGRVTTPESDVCDGDEKDGDCDRTG
jgi:hypothetical protein